MSPVLLLSFASVFELAGGVLIALVVLGVHSRIIKEHKIDDLVLKTMRKERAYVLTGLFLLSISFILEVSVRLVYGVSI